MTSDVAPPASLSGPPRSPNSSSLNLLGRVDRRTPDLRIPEYHWPGVEAGLWVLLDAPIEEDFAGWRGQTFLKDIAVAQLRMLPNRGNATPPFGNTRGS